MPQRIVVIADPVGLHARPAAAFAKAAAASGLAITLARPDGAPADARSVLAIMALGVRGGETLVLSAEGELAAETLDQLAALIDGAGGSA